MRAELVAALRCPLCAQPLALATGEPRDPLRCPRGHSFDQAKGGYPQLSAGPLTHPGDTVSMVAARSAFLGAGHYAFLTAALAGEAARRYPGGLIADIGGGTGAHLAGVLDAVPHAYGLVTDVAAAAVRVAARAHPRADAIVADSWRPLPIADGAAGVVLNVFAPRPGAELRRILRADGALLVATPAEDHLGELIAPLGLLRVDPDKAERVTAALGTGFVRVAGADLRQPMRLRRAEAEALAGMGPSAHHRTPDAIRAGLAALPEPIAVTAAVTLGIYVPR